jgi:hypothetical protein
VRSRDRAGVPTEWNVHYEEVIKGSIALYEAAIIDGLVTDEDVAGFLALAERWYASR